MNKSIRFLIRSITCAVMIAAMIQAQSRGGNWPTYGGDAQHSGWEGADARITKGTAKDLQLLWKMKLDSQTKGLLALLPPAILGRLISYRGFKELAFVGTNADIVYAIDADLGKMFWQKHLEYSVAEPQSTSSSWACPGGLTATPTMPVPPPAAGRGGPPNNSIGGPASVFAISSDGRLHRLNTSTGDDMTPPVSVLPANARIAGLNMIGNVIYAVTSQGCNGAQDAVWAIDLSGGTPSVASFDLNGGNAWGLGGPVVGTDGTVYVQTSSSLLSLSPKDIRLKHSFPIPSANSKSSTPSPAVFAYGNRDLIVMATTDGRFLLLDSTSNATLYQTPRIAAEVWGSISSWMDAEGTRWVLAPVWGPLDFNLKGSTTNGPTPNGSIVAFKVEEQNGKPVLTLVWTSRDLSSPMPPVITSGVVFALSAGEFNRQIQRPKGSTHTTLYALDATTGKELYSSRNLVTAPASLTGLTVANGRVYFGTIDGTFYAFGMYMEH
jgi:outer membrane protein assembly factor BamB